MKAGKTENQFETGFQQPKTGLPKNGINISTINRKGIVGHRFTM